jgi:hypothetical protein
MQGLDELLKTGLPPGVKAQLDEGSRLQQIKSLDRGNPLLAGECIHQGKMTLLDAATQTVRGQAHAVLLTNSLVVRGARFCLSTSHPPHVYNASGKAHVMRNVFRMPATLPPTVGSRHFHTRACCLQRASADPLPKTLAVRPHVTI